MPGGVLSLRYVAVALSRFITYKFIFFMIIQGPREHALCGRWRLGEECRALSAAEELGSG